MNFLGFHQTIKKLFLQYPWGFAVGMSLLIFLGSSWPFPPQPPIAIPFYDKWIHIFTYMLLGFCYLNVTTKGFTELKEIRMGLGYGGAVLYGVSDEFHQSFVPGRYSDWQDVFADMLGAGLAWICVKLYFSFHKHF